jgi:hypothetical protein
MSITNQSYEINLLSTARIYCANWDNGNCLGCMMKRSNGMLTFHISSKFANKPCQVKKKCDYFNNIVIPGVTDGT